MLIIPRRRQPVAHRPSFRLQQPIVLGRRADNGEPVIFPRSFFVEKHAHVRGIPGSGKSSQVFLSLILQLLDSADDPDDPPEPLVVIDLGGDQGLFHSVRHAALAAGRTFRFFSTDPDDDSAYFNPFQGVRPGRDHVLHLSSMLIRAFNLDYGLFYGGDYFTSQNTKALLQIARQLVRHDLKPAQLTVEDLAIELENSKVRDADQIKTIFMFLDEYPQLKPHLAAPEASCIELRRAIDAGEVIYFFMPTIAESISARPIAGLALYTLQQIAQQRMREGRARRNCYVFIDEFHEIAGTSFERFVVQCRKSGVNLFLANQNNQQLASRDVDLHKIILGATQLKLYFNFLGEEEIDEALGMSRETRVRLAAGSETEGTATSRGHSVSVGESTNDKGTTARSGETWSESEGESRSTSHGWREAVAKELTVNEILDVDATAGRCLMFVRTGEGHQEPVPLNTQHCLPAEMASHFETLPLPKRPAPLPRRPRPGEPTRRPASTSPTSTPAAPAESPAVDDPYQESLQAMWRASFEELRMANLRASSSDAEAPDDGAQEPDAPQKTRDL